THVRISRDLLRTRSREQVLLRACLESGQPFVVDNTNVRAEERARYIAAAKAAGYRVVGYFFRTETRAAIARNRLRTGKAVVPVPGILGTRKKLEEPRMEEGFDALYAVTLTPANEFVVEPFVSADPAAG
ncbi:MAG TPA: AAA family ATPase, partial [Longimicrobium sp.]